MAVHRAPLVDERGLFASFPFLPGAEALIEEIAPSVGALFREPGFAPSQAGGRARVRLALEDPAGGREAPEVAQLAPDERFLSFQFARLLLSAAPGRGPIRRWAVAEAKVAGRRLERETDPVLSEVAHRLGYEFEIDGRGVRLALPDYLHLATPIREADFRLARQALRGGRIRLDRERAVRLLEEAVRIALTEPVALAPATRGAIEERESEFLGEIAARMPAAAARPGAGFGRLRPERFPPCIRMMRRTLEDGENLSHSGRFALAAFLHRAGADFEGIVDAYRGAPDFDESVTRYQVEHITSRDDQKGYSPPDCATLRSHGLCAREGDPGAHDPARRRSRDPLCFEEFLRNPIQYYRIVVEGRGDRAEPGPTGPAGGASDTPSPPSTGRSTAPPR